MRLLTCLALLSLTLASSSSFACRPRTIPLEDRIHASKSIWRGVVTGEILTGRERHIITKQKHEPIFPEEYTLRVVVTERLKGSRRRIVEVPIRSCGSGHGQLLDRVVVFRDRKNSYYIATEQDVIVDVRRILSAKR